MLTLLVFDESSYEKVTITIIAYFRHYYYHWQEVKLHGHPITY